MKMSDGMNELIKWFSSRAEDHRGLIPPFSYRDAAAAIGLENWKSNAQFFGQLQSCVDFACYKAGLPPLGLLAERAFKDAWAREGRAWDFPINDMTAAARSRTWTGKDFLMITAAAGAVPPAGHITWDDEFEKDERGIQQWADGFAGFPQRMSSGRPIAYWWANQNQTYKDEVHGGFLWSPKMRADGGRNKFYENMQDVLPGDIVFSFCDTRIKAVGLASSAAQTSPKPDFGNVGDGWSKEGWLVPAEFRELSNKIRPKDHIQVLIPHLPPKYSPLQQNGDGLQSVYLAKISDSMAHEMIKLIGPEYHSVLANLSAEVDVDASGEDALERAIEGRTDIGATTKSQLVNSRRGQGIFKANVRLNESACRVTGVKDPAHLRASHIKPWRLADDGEKLNGCNGLLLAPHVDHLFDSGLISFTDDGDMLVSLKLNPDVLIAWGISAGKSVGRFNAEQARFLDFHRTRIFKD